MEHTWRWFGPDDPISLSEIRQTGATGIVTALHHIPNGEVWSTEEILKRKNLITDAGLSWSVVESVPVHEDIKKQKGDYKRYIENYKTSLRNLGHCGINVVCYNFMPVLDWSRTDLNFRLSDGSEALLFDINAFIAFDLFILKRKNAEKDYSEKQIDQAAEYFKTLDDNKIKTLTRNILAGLPGSEETYSLESFNAVLDEYQSISKSKFKQNLFDFLNEIIPVAEASGVRMAIHPDDPPFSLLGLPRIVSTLEDAMELVSAIDSPSNGITLCTGSFGAGHFNNCTEIAKALAGRINFVHLRNVSNDADGNFHENPHLYGVVDMYAVIKEILLEEKRRHTNGLKNYKIPMRPDHGNKILDDFSRKTNPGYSLIGRMKGLAEIRGLELGIRKSLEENR